MIKRLALFWHVTGSIAIAARGVGIVLSQAEKLKKSKEFKTALKQVKEDMRTKIYLEKDYILEELYRVMKTCEANGDTSNWLKSIDMFNKHLNLYAPEEIESARMDFKLEII